MECPGGLYEIQNCNTNSCQDNCCDSIEIYYDGPLRWKQIIENRYRLIYGYYVRQEDLINGRPWYKNDGRSIWWDGKNNNWKLGSTTKKGSSSGFAKLDNDGRCLPKIPNQNWKLGAYSGWYVAGNNVKVRCGHKPKGNY